MEIIYRWFYECKKKEYIIFQNKSFFYNYTFIIIILICISIIVIYYYFGNYFISYYRMYYKNNNKNEYDLVIPCKPAHIQLLNEHKKFYRKYLNYTNLILIGPSNLKNFTLNDTSITFINEDDLVPKNQINEFLSKMRSLTTSKSGWLEQQFVKMAYSRICKKNYYLVWDIDTIPIRPIQMFEGDHPFFDMKTEHHKAYFRTMNILIPHLKFRRQSYISEHMIIKTNLMKDLLDTIEKNSNISGKFFWEKIVMVIDDRNIKHQGFSEFETYGTFVDNKYPNIYTHRKWYSRRDAKIYIGSANNLNEDDIIWLSRSYHALLFEKLYRFVKRFLKFVKDPEIHKLYKPSKFFRNVKKIIKTHKVNKTR